MDKKVKASDYKCVECGKTPNNAFNKEVAGNHYRQYKIQPIELIFAMGWNFAQGNIAKYVLRARYKNGREDIEKSIHYCELAIAAGLPCDDDIYSPDRPILEFVEKNGLDKTFWVSFLHKIDERQYSELRNILSDNQTVEKYFLKN
jgi:hypothetical protein